MGLLFDTYGIFISPANARLNGSIFSSRRRTREKGIIFSKRLSPKNPEARDFDFWDFQTNRPENHREKRKRRFYMELSSQLEVKSSEMTSDELIGFTIKNMTMYICLK